MQEGQQRRDDNSKKILRLVTDEKKREENKSEGRNKRKIAEWKQQVKKNYRYRNVNWKAERQQTLTT